MLVLTMREFGQFVRIKSAWASIAVPPCEGPTPLADITLNGWHNPLKTSATFKE